MRSKLKSYFLVVCLFVFLFIVIGAGLHLNPVGALAAALSETPLIIHCVNRWCGVGPRAAENRGTRARVVTGLPPHLTQSARGVCRTFRDQIAPMLRRFEMTEQVVKHSVAASSDEGTKQVSLLSTRHDASTFEKGSESAASHDETG